MSKESKASGGIGFPGILAIVFITLKLIGKITWSWWWVLSPLWIPLAILFAFLTVAVIGCGIASLLDE
jgi:hypothetical protein